MPEHFYSHLVELGSLKRPFWRYFELFEGDGHAFLFDSAMPDSRLSRFSFLGGAAMTVFRAKRIFKRGEKARARIQVSDFDVGEYVSKAPLPCEVGRIEKEVDDPFAALAELIRRHRPERFPVQGGSVWKEIPFLQGAVGYIGYEAGYFIEALPDTGVDDLELPDIYMFFPSVVFAHEHATGRTWLSLLLRAENPSAAEKQAEKASCAWQSKIADFEALDLVNEEEVSTPPTVAVAGSLPLTTHFTEESYCRAVEEIKNRIAAGEIYQACLTQRMETAWPGGSAWPLYRILRRINPAPFAAYLRLPEVEVVSSSPERFLKCDKEGKAESRPIKGTRPRGATHEEDERLRQELFDSPKDRAENAMIVDLVRNDFGRVCRFRSVSVPEFMAIETYATVFQMVSTVEGRLNDSNASIDLLRACFPGGSMTGAPKIEAMKILDSLEPVKRGIYSGGIGYLDCSGACDFGMVIRTILVKGDRCYFHVGGGIVADSIPLAEYQETLDKAKALIRGLEMTKNTELPSKDGVK